MTEPLIKKWSENEGVLLTEEAVRDRHRPLEYFRITPDRYPPGAEFLGASRASTLYILGGACHLQIGTTMLALVAGDILEFPKGPFQIKVDEGEELRLVKVWELPPQFRRPTD